MRIGIDARWIQPEITGIGSYTQSLIRHLATVHSPHTFVLLFESQAVRDRTFSYAQIEGHPQFESHLIPYGPFSWRSQIELPNQLRALQLDIYHSPNFMIPFRAFPKRKQGSLACIVTIHDLIPLLFPEFTPKALKTRFHPVYRQLMKEVGARADGIITVSESSRRDIINHMAIPADRHHRIAAIYEGVSSDYSPASTPSVGERTILYVGRMDPYKNVPALVEAFARLIQSGLKDVRLKIIGPKDPRYPRVDELIAQHQLADHVDWPGYVTGEELLDAYRSASVFVLPSRYEGFGLPVLEAMACGTPVICSNRASLPEVAGEAARLIDPGDSDALVNALIDVLSNPDIANSMREKGLQQATRFSWQRTATETVRVYEMMRTFK